MAIRIPVRSSASASVGGSTIRVPTDRKTTVNLPSTNLLSSVPNAIAPAFDKLTQFLEVVSERKKAHDKEIEKQRIRNKNTLNKSLLTNDVNQILEDVRNNKNLSTSSGETYNKYWNEESVKLKTKYKKLYKDDDLAYEEFLSDFHQVIGTGQTSMWTLRNNQVLAESQISYDLEHLDVLNQIDSLTVDEHIWTKFKPIFEQKKKSIAGMLKIDQNSVTNVDEVLFDLRVRVWEKIFEAEAGSITSPDGASVVNWKAYYTNLTALPQEGDKWVVAPYGEYLTKHMRTHLIKKAKEQLDAQDSVFSAMRTENSTNDYKSFNKELVAFLNGKTENMDTFLSRLETNPNLSSTQISALRTAFKTTQTHIASGSSTWDSALGLQTKAVLTFLVNSGAIDTKSEMQVINNAQLNGLLEPAYATTLMDNAKKYTQERNKIKLTMTKTAISMVSRELNIDSSYMDKFEQAIAQNPDLTGEEQFGLLMGLANNSKNPKEAYEALLNISQLLAEGESKGFTWKEMLLDKGGANYILDDIISVHKQNIDKAQTIEWTKGLNNLEGAENASVKILGGSYFITDDYFTNKTSTVTKVEMPQRNEGESILDYTKRIGAILPKDVNPFFPSWVSNDMSIGDLDVSGILIQSAK